MTKNYIKRNDKIYEVREIEVRAVNLEFHIAQVDAIKAELVADLTAMNALEGEKK